jgi:hypothetical protein
MKKTLSFAFILLVLTGLAACNSTLMINQGLIAAPTQTFPATDPIFTPTPYPVEADTTSYRPSITWLELNDFLASDHTNWNQYIEGKYNCVNFSLDLISNARADNIYAWLVYVVFDPEEPAHAFVAIKTSDKGVVWIEPQSDYAYAEVAVGEPLCLRIDTTKCSSYGLVTKVVDPAECNPVTYECWASTAY